MESNKHYCEYAISRCNTAIRAVSGMEVNYAEQLFCGDELQSTEDHEELQSILYNSRQLILSVRTLSSLWEERLELLSVQPSRSPPILVTRQLGRPPFVLSMEQVHFLSEMSFSWVQIALLLDISRQTLWRRRTEWGLQSQTASSITDEELSSVIETVRQNHPHIGESIATGIIHAITGHRVTRCRIRRAIRAVDPLFTSLRWRNGLVVRRPYSVAGPNALWHIGKSPAIYISFWDDLYSKTSYYN